MTDKINPRIVDGEPVGNRDCYYHHNERCTFIGCGAYLTPCIPSSNSTCIPGLRQQRNQALQERDDARREICIAICDKMYLANVYVTQKQIAKQRGWNDLKESEWE